MRQNFDQIVMLKFHLVCNVCAFRSNLLWGEVEKMRFIQIAKKDCLCDGQQMGVK